MGHRLFLYRFSRHLARYGVQACLQSPILALPSLRPVSGLPESFDERMVLALKTADPGIRFFAWLLSFFPERVTEKEAAVCGSVSNPFLFEASEKDIGDYEKTLEALYGVFIKKYGGEGREFVESLERISAIDFCLSGASLERIRDCFYEDERIIVPKVNWVKTDRHRLELENPAELSELKSKDSFRMLVYVMAKLSLSEGALVLYDPQAWGEAGHKLSVRSVFPEISLTTADRRGIFSWLKNRDFPPSSFKALLFSKIIGKIEKQAEAAGVSDIFSWLDFDELSAFRSRPGERSHEFLKEALALDEVQRRKMSLRRSPAGFFTKPRKIAEMIMEGEVGQRFRPRTVKRKSAWIAVVMLLILLWIRSTR